MLFTFLITRIIGIPGLLRCCIVLLILSNGVVYLDQLSGPWYCISWPANGCLSYHTHILSQHEYQTSLVIEFPLYTLLNFFSFDLLLLVCCSFPLSAFGAKRNHEWWISLSSQLHQSNNVSFHSWFREYLKHHFINCSFFIFYVFIRRKLTFLNWLQVNIWNFYNFN